MGGKDQPDLDGFLAEGVGPVGGEVQRPGGGSVGEQGERQRRPDRSLLQDVASIPGPPLFGVQVIERMVACSETAETQGPS